MTEKTNNIEEAEIQYKQALKNYHKESNRHVFVLEEILWTRKNLAESTTDAHTLYAV